MPIHLEGGRNSMGIPKLNPIPQRDLQEYLNAIEPFGGEMLRRQTKRLSHTPIKSLNKTESLNLSNQDLHQHPMDKVWEADFPLSA